MASVSDEALVIAKVYAGSMLTLADQAGDADNLLDELQDLAGMIEKNPDLERFFISPTVDADARKATIEKVFRGHASDLLVNSLQVLNAKDRLDILPAVVESYRTQHQALRNRVEVGVASVVPLSDDSRNRIRDIAGKHTGNEVALVERIDESLVGGVVIQIGDTKFDSSVARDIDSLAHAMRERSLREIHGKRNHVE